MPLEQVGLQQTVLAFLADAPPPLASEHMTATDWARVVSMGRDHRLLPLLYSRLTQSARCALIPPNVRAILEAAFRQRALRSLAIQSEILHLDRCLQEIGVRGIFLKGAFLAFHAYPHPALRPMRDIDVLLQREQALAAYDHLLSRGYRRIDAYAGSPQAALASLKHLPPIRAASGGVGVELHTRLSEFALIGETVRADLTDDDSLWRTTIVREVAGHHLNFLSPTDQLLHLIVHAVYDHLFNCGPLVITDVAYLLQNSTIDWRAFWRKADMGRWSPGCRLLLHIVNASYPLCAISTRGLEGEPSLDEDMVQAATSAMLADPNKKLNVRLRADLLKAKSWTAKMRVVLGRIVPSTDRVAALQGRGIGGTTRQATYRDHWRRLCLVRIPQLISGRFDPRETVEARTAAKLLAWIGK